MILNYIKRPNYSGNIRNTACSLSLAVIVKTEMRLTVAIILFLTAILCFGQNSKVIRVIDGDTFETEHGKKVRMIGINAPELSDIYGIEAKEHLKELIEHKEVILVLGKISKDKDRYQRLLRYVYYESEDINRKMIDDGFAFAYLKYKFEKSNEYENAQLESKANCNGIWSNDSNVNLKNKEKDKKRFDFKNLPAKTYLVATLLFILIIIGLVYYFKK